MNTQQIENILSRIIPPNRCRFLGVFAKDKIPSPNSLTHSFPICFVANTHDSHNPGEHWLAFFYDSPTSLEFFDSYGFSPDFYNFQISPTRMNHQPIQSLTSSVCGQYCIFYLYHRSLGYSLSKILSSFSITDLDWNDKRVSHFICKNFSFPCTSSHKTKCQCCVSPNCQK